MTNEQKEVARKAKGCTDIILPGEKARRGKSNQHAYITGGRECSRLGEVLLSSAQRQEQRPQVLNEIEKNPLSSLNRGFEL